jgi:CelD/BcsL family acetyltransferase involved in cellulose biosynthesis
MAIDLAHCVQIEDLNVAAPSSGASSVSGATSSVSAATTTTDDDTLLVQLDHSFRLTMQDGGDVSFYADDAESKAKWLAILERVRGKDRPVPAWATALRRMQKEQYLAASASARTVGGGAAPLLPSKSSRILPPRTFSVPA